jgi:hypothetical protein
VTLVGVSLRLRFCWALAVSVSEFFGELVCVRGMFVSLFAKLVRAQVISFSMGDRGSSVGMGGKIMEFSGPLMFSL